MHQLAAEGLEAGRIRDYPRAVRIFSALAQNGWPEALLYLGRSYHGVGDCFMAAQVLKEYVRSHLSAPQGWFYLGRAYLGLGLFPRAVSAFKKSAQLGFDSPQLLGLLGTALLKNRQPEEAVDLLGAAVSRVPEHQGIKTAYFNALLVLGLKNFHLHRYAAAKEILEFLDGQNLHSDVVTVHLAGCFRQLGQYDQAHDFYLKASLSSPDDKALMLHRAECLIHLGQPDKARQLIKAAGIVPLPAEAEKSTPTLEQQLILRLLEAKKFRQAVFHSLKALKEGLPAAGFYHHAVYKAYYALGDRQKALGHLHQVRKIHPEDHGFYCEMLALLWELKNYAGIRKEVRHFPGQERDMTSRYYDLLARCRLNPGQEEDWEELTQFESVSPPDPFLYQALAEAERSRHQEVQAVSWAKKALKLHPALEEAMEIILEVETRDPDSFKGIKSLVKAFLAYCPDHTKAQKTYVRILFREGRYKEAVKLLQAEIQRFGSRPGLLRALAFCYRQDGRWENALALYHGLLGKDPKNGTLLANTLYCLEKTGRHDTAARLAAAAVSAQPRNTTLLVFLGHHYYRQSERDMAGRMLRKALEENPQCSEAWLLLSRIAEDQGDKAKADRYRRQGSTKAKSPGKPTGF